MATTGYTVQIKAKVICRACGSEGMVYGPYRMVPDGVGGQMLLRDERDCQPCSGRGHTFELVELDAAALIALGNAIQAVMSTEYAEAVQSTVIAERQRAWQAEADYQQARAEGYHAGVFGTEA